MGVGEKKGECGGRGPASRGRLGNAQSLGRERGEARNTEVTEPKD